MKRQVDDIVEGLQAEILNCASQEMLEHLFKLVNHIYDEQDPRKLQTEHHNNTTKEKRYR